METISFEHGGKEYDEKYPDGIPTSMKITLVDGTVLDSGFVMYPAGHARNTTANLNDILVEKFKMHGEIAMDDPSGVRIERSDLLGLSGRPGPLSKQDGCLAQLLIFALPVVQTVDDDVTVRMFGPEHRVYQMLEGVQTARLAPQEQFASLAIDGDSSSVVDGDARHRHRHPHGPGHGLDEPDHSRL